MCKLDQIGSNVHIVHAKTLGDGCPRVSANRDMGSLPVNRMLSAADYGITGCRFLGSSLPIASSEQPILLFLNLAPGFHTQCRTHKGGVRGGAPVNASLAWCNGSGGGKAQNAEKGLLIRLQHG